MGKSYLVMLRAMCSMLDSRKRVVADALDSIIMQRYIGSMMKPFFSKYQALHFYGERGWLLTN